MMESCLFRHSFLFGGVNMIKPKYAIGYIFKDRLGYTYEVIDRIFDGKELIYHARSIDAGVIFVCLRKK